MMFFPLMGAPLQGDPLTPILAPPAAVTLTQGQDVLLLAEISGGPPLATPSGEAMTLFMSDGFWQGSPTDADRPNQPYDSRIVSGSLVLERKIPILPEDSSRGEVSVSSLTLLTGDGVIAPYLQTRSFGRRKIEAWLGPALMPRDAAKFSDFTKVLSGVIASGLQVSRTKTQIDVREAGIDLQKPFQQNLYAGTGGLEGGDTVKGKRKPFWAGKRPNVPGVLLDEYDCIWQFHDGPMQALDEIRDQAVPIPISSNVAWQGTAEDTYAALAAVTVPEGYVCTALSIGCLKYYTNSVVGPLTAAGRGDNDPALGGYQDTHTGLAIFKVLQRFGVTAAELDPSTFAAWPDGEAGFYSALDESRTTEDTMNLIAKSCLGWWRVEPDGRYVAGRLVDPTLLAPAIDISEANAFSVDQLAPLQRPRYRQPVNYQQNDRPQSASEVSPSLDAETSAFYIQQYSTYTAGDDPDILDLYANPFDPPAIESLFCNSIDAIQLNAFAMGLHGQERWPFQVVLKDAGQTLRPGWGATLTWPDLGVSNMPVVITAHSYDAGTKETTLMVWG